MMFISALFIVTTLGISAFLFLFPSVAHWKFGIGRYPTQSLISRRTSEIVIDKNYRATISRKSELTFLTAPSKEDLIDAIDLLPGEEIHQRSYTSPDSDVVDSRQKSPDTLAIYWDPKEDIQPLVPYRHEMSYISPTLYGDDAFYHSIYFDRDVGTSDLVIRSDNQVEEALAFVMPFFAARVTTSRLYRYGFSGRRRGCEQPMIEADGHTIRWHLDNPKKGKIYVLLAIYQGQRERYLRESREQLLLPRITQKIHQLAGSPQISEKR
tara:strand:- start:2713 stop:3513 length:801 start_codon:yes stop_codon:yes gene_type:complete